MPRRPGRRGRANGGSKVAGCRLHLAAPTVAVASPRRRLGSEGASASVLLCQGRPPPPSLLERTDARPGRPPRLPRDRRARLVRDLCASPGPSLPVDDRRLERDPHRTRAAPRGAAARESRGAALPPRVRHVERSAVAHARCPDELRRAPGLGRAALGGARRRADAAHRAAGRTRAEPDSRSRGPLAARRGRAPGGRHGCVHRRRHRTLRAAGALARRVHVARRRPSRACRRPAPGSGTGEADDRRDGRRRARGLVVRSAPEGDVPLCARARSLSLADDPRTEGAMGTSRPRTARRPHAARGGDPPAVRPDRRPDGRAVALGREGVRGGRGREELGRAAARPVQPGGRGAPHLRLLDPAGRGDRAHRRDGFPLRSRLALGRARPDLVRVRLPRRRGGRGREPLLRSVARAPRPGDCTDGGVVPRRGDRRRRSSRWWAS